MDEIRDSAALADFEALKRARPEWLVARVEPFMTSPQDDVQSPTWGKVKLDNTVSSGTSTQNSQANIRCITVLDGIATYIFVPGTIGETV